MMSRLSFDYVPSDKTKNIFSTVEKSMGGVINIFKLMGNSPQALEGYMAFSGALAQGTLSPAEREHVALAVAGFNECDYCGSAHAFLGSKQGISSEEIQRNFKGKSSQESIQQLLSFCYKVLGNNGHVSDDDLSQIRAAGYNDEKIVEIVATIVINIFTNYFNNVAQTPIDFPKVNRGE